MNIFNKLFGSKKTQNHSSELTIPEAEKIMHSYSEFIQTDSPSPGSIADSSKLPFSKNEIKSALRIALSRIDDPAFINAASMLYLQLANWQDGVGNDDVGLDIGELNPSDDINDLLKGVLSADNLESSWKELVAKEEQELELELAAILR